MIAVYKEHQNNDCSWQKEFVDMLPEIRKWLRLAFRHLNPEAREDAIEEAIIYSLLSYSRLHGKDRAERANASSLAWYAVRAVKCGRPAVGRLSAKEPLSRYAQLSSGVRLERQKSEWIDKLVEDKRASVPDQVAAKLDVRAWFATLTNRMNQIAKDLALGCSTNEVAQKYGITAGRISQLRRMLEDSWAAFQQESSPTIG